MNKLDRPILGLMPRWLHNELYFDDTSNDSRLNNIKEAIERYNKASETIPIEWLEEKKEIEDSRK